jgi:superfamily II DNA or RNA helicase
MRLTNRRTDGNLWGEMTIHRNSPLSARLNLFRSLFRGREDVYPRRFQSVKTGKSGYQPVCANEWIRGLCDKGRVRCAECRNRRFVPLSDEAIDYHLSGRDQKGRDFVIGVYPMLPDETCLFLAIDFDKAGWQGDGRAFLETAGRMGIPAVLERSRSGNGGHIWLFFDEPIPAGIARRLGSLVLTETMEGRPEIGFDSYDRLFPNQDTLPKGGFGGLIALPLQGRAIEQGNSLFLDGQFQPYPDQWVFLSGIARMGRDKVETLVHEAEKKGRIIGVRAVSTEEETEEPWTLPPSRRRKEALISGPLPKAMELVLGNEIYIPKDGLVPGLRNRLLGMAAFQNPEFYRAQSMRLPTYDIPRIIACGEDYPLHIGLPRGCLEDVKGLLSGLKIVPLLKDERCPGVPLSVSFQGVLRPEQEAAAEALAAHDIGVLSAGTAFGKTVVAAWLIAQRGVNTLILVHRLQLLEQWVERLSTFLGVPAQAIGRIGGGQKKPTGLIDVALLQSLVRKGVVKDLVAEYGHLVVDECHHLSAHSFEQVARRARARFVTGLSATVTRKDGHHPIIFMECGPVRHRVGARDQAHGRPFGHTVLVRPTGFRATRQGEGDARSQFQELYDELTADEARNRLICDDIIEVVGEGRSPIVLTERREHLERIAESLSPRIRNLIILRGGMNRKELKGISDRLASLPDQEERVLLATGKYIGEGFDDARLDTLFLTLPVSWKGTVAQYAGRLHRLHELKWEVRVYDYADLNVPMLARMFDRRCRGYEAIGYTISLPGNAVPGWPPDIALPSDPGWKKDYSATVRRLVRDGVDNSLAGLFLNVAALKGYGETSPEGGEGEGAMRARSATETFLFKRLETLPETAGKFRLNGELPLPISGRGRMEVDLLCGEGRVVVELDGDHHFSDKEAYRRDRRKDAVLQENGYFVLRFLAEDVGTHLDDVLDTILRVMANRAAR